jgi:hypothetical protein
MGKTSQQSAEKLLTAFSLLTMVKTVKEITYDMVTCHQKCATTQSLLETNKLHITGTNTSNALVICEEIV